MASVQNKDGTILQFLQGQFLQDVVGSFQWHSVLIAWYWLGTCCTLNHCTNNTSTLAHMSGMNFGRARAPPGLAFATPLVHSKAETQW